VSCAYAVENEADGLDEEDQPDVPQMTKRREHHYVAVATLSVVAVLIYKLWRRMQEQRRASTGGSTVFTAVPSGVYEAKKPTFRLEDDEDDGLLAAEDGRVRPVRAQ